jgi:hypothetical protein
MPRRCCCTCLQASLSETTLLLLGYSLHGNAILRPSRLTKIESTFMRWFRHRSQTALSPRSVFRRTGAIIRDSLLHPLVLLAPCSSVEPNPLRQALRQCWEWYSISEQLTSMLGQEAMAALNRFVLLGTLTLRNTHTFGSLCDTRPSVRVLSRVRVPDLNCRLYRISPKDRAARNAEKNPTTRSRITSVVQLDIHLCC